MEPYLHSSKHLHVWYLIKGWIRLYFRTSVSCCRSLVIYSYNLVSAVSFVSSHYFNRRFRCASLTCILNAKKSNAIKCQQIIFTGTRLAVAANNTSSLGNFIIIIIIIVIIILILQGISNSRPVRFRI